jgi:flagellar hook-associated protein 2
MAGIQLGGLASGLDTEGMISQLMQLEAQPAVRWTQQKSVSQVREQALKDILARVKNLQTEAKNLKSVTTWADTQTVDTSDATKISATRVAGAAPGSYSLSVSRLASGDQYSMMYNQPLAGSPDTYFEITTSSGTQRVDVVAGQSLEETVGIINSNPDSKVYAVKVGDRLVLSSRDTGGTAAFTVTPVSSTDVLSDSQKLRTAIDAEYSLDGGLTHGYSKSNVVKDGIAGIEFTLKSTIAVGSEVTLNVSNPTTDTTAIKSKVKAFVDQYNSTIDLIRTKLTEQKVKDPKTDADRAKGVLYNDSMLNGLLQRLRTTVAGSFNTGDANADQLAEIGISTGKATGGAASADSLAGKLVIDDAKLSEALATSPQAVRKLLGATTGVDGLGTTLDAMLTTVVADNGDFDGRLKSADKEQKNYDDQIAILNKRIDAKAAMLRAQFAAMETAISRSQQQQSWLAGQFK